MIYGDVNICHAIVNDDGYISYIGTRCHERRKGYATALLNELKLKFESLTCKTHKTNKVANKLFTNLGTKTSEDDKFNYYAF